MLSAHPALTLLGSFVGLLAFAFVHELAHYFTARSFGIDARITVGRRFYILVLQTDVTNAWALPKRARLRIFLAGMAFNLTVASVLGILLFAQDAGYVSLGEWTRWLRFAVFVNVMPLAFQLMFFARTDLYYVLALATRDRNLAGDARAALRSTSKRIWARLRARPPPAAADGFDPQARRRLVLFGIGFLAAQSLIWAYAALIGWQFQLRLILVGLFMMRGGPLDVLEGGIVVALASVQLAMLVWFIGGGIGRMGMDAWKRRTATEAPIG
jgi:hypothetical protein